MEDKYIVGAATKQIVPRGNCCVCLLRTWCVDSVIGNNLFASQRGKTLLKQRRFCGK